MTRGTGRRTDAVAWAAREGGRRKSASAGCWSAEAGREGPRVKAEGMPEGSPTALRVGGTKGGVWVSVRMLCRGRA